MTTETPPIYSSIVDHMTPSSPWRITLQKETRDKIIYKLYYVTGPDRCPNCNGRLYATSMRVSTYKDVPYGDKQVLIRAVIYRYACQLRCDCSYMDVPPGMSQHHRITQALEDEIIRRCRLEPTAKIALSVGLDDKTVRTIRKAAQVTREVARQSQQVI
jgi:hypothetical protein